MQTTFLTGLNTGISLHTSVRYGDYIARSQMNVAARAAPTVYAVATLAVQNEEQFANRVYDGAEAAGGDIYGLLVNDLKGRTELGNGMKCEAHRNINLRWILSVLMKT